MFKNKYTVLAVLLVSVCSGYSCSCLVVSIESEVDKTDAIFSGRIMKMEIEGYSYETIEGSLAVLETLVVVLQVNRVLKGEVVSGSTVTVTTPHSSSCGINFDFHKNYLVYARKSDESKDRFSTGLCTRTKTLTKSMGQRWDWANYEQGIKEEIAIVEAIVGK